MYAPRYPQPDIMTVPVPLQPPSYRVTAENSRDSRNYARQPVVRLPVIPPPEPEEIVIAVMGATGSGKSTFINTISGSDLAVGKGLKSCTSKVETGNTFELFGKLITLVDTPGFDDTTISDTDILKMIAVYLSTTYQNGNKLSGIIYMHRISDVRMGGISRRNFSMFRKLCGDDTLNNVVVVTNMWGTIPPETGEARETELRTDPLLFQPVLEKGALMLRHDNTRASAQAILRHIVDNRPAALAIQREIVDEGKDITQTAAGVELDRELAALREKHLHDLAEIQREMEAALAAKDLETKAELEAVRTDLLKNVQQIEGDRDRLSREFELEKARADEKVREIQEQLEEEREARAENRRQIGRLTQEMETNRTATAAERRAMQRELDALRKKRSGGGFFGSIGRAIDSIFGL